MGDHIAADGVTPDGPTPERLAAFRVLQRVGEGAYADRALAGEADRLALTGASRGQAHRLAFGAVQRMRTLDWLVDAALKRPADVEVPVRDVLRLATFELVFSDAVRSATAVDQAVRLVRTLPGPAKRVTARAGLVNAVLRTLAADARQRLDLLSDDTAEHAAILHSVPDWIAERLFAGLGPDAARGVLEHANRPTESALRWNPLRGSRSDLEASLPAGWRRDPLLDDAYLLDGPFALEDSDVWRRGLAMAQSRASMLPAIALDPQPGERILDLCAAPGAKATQLAALAANRATVVCVEARPARAKALRELASRMGATVEVIEGDGRTVAVPGPFDAVLVDPPCTGLGVLATRPDARWRRRETDVAELVELQGALLARAASQVRPGGRVVYSTCTVLAEENEGVVRASGLAVDDLTGRFPDFGHPELPGALRTLPHLHATDGFFVARLLIPNG